MIFSARHTVTVDGCPARFVIREPSYAEERQWAEAHDRAIDEKSFADMVDVDAELIARVLIRIEGETDEVAREVLPGPFTADAVKEMLPGRCVPALAAEVQAAGRPKPKPSPSGDDTPT